MWGRAGVALLTRLHCARTDGMDSDCMSQDDLSQSRSQGEPSSCSKATAGPRCRPPTGLKSKKRQEGPSRLGPVVTRLK